MTSQEKQTNFTIQLNARLRRLVPVEGERETIRANVLRTFAADPKAGMAALRAIGGSKRTGQRIRGVFTPKDRNQASR